MASAAAQGRVYSRSAVGGAGAVVDLADLFEELGVGAAPLRRVTLLSEPAVVGRRGDTEDFQDRGDPEPALQ